MTDFTANFTLEEIEAINATFVVNSTPTKLSELVNDADYVQDADYIHTDNNFTDILLSNLNNQSGVNTGDQILPTKTSDLTNDSGFITSSSVPTALSELSDDSTHRLVTDTEKSTWSSKQSALGFTPEDINNKVTAFQSIPDNTHYPSEKLVKDNIDLINMAIGDISTALDLINGEVI